MKVRFRNKDNHDVCMMIKNIMTIDDYIYFETIDDVTHRCKEEKAEDREVIMDNVTYRDFAKLNGKVEMFDHTTCNYYFI